MRESKIESKCKAYIENDLDGHMIKLQGIGSLGWPDRVVLVPRGFVAFVELKKPGRVPTEIQYKRLATLQKKGFHAFWTADYENFKAEITARINRGSDLMPSLWT
jgi:hypothetical protein